MLKFKQIIEKAKVNVGGPSADYAIANYQDDDDEAKDIKPRSQGEVDFRDKHTITTTKHPVAEPGQSGPATTKHAGDHKGHDGEPGEREVVKSKGKTFKELRATKKAIATAKANKSAGEMQMKKIKEEVEEVEDLDENVMVRIKMKNIAKSKTPVSYKFKNGKSMTVDPDQAKMLHKALQGVKGPSLKAMSNDIMSSPAGFMKALAFAERK